jgi:protein-tyrosine phosphatase
MTTNHSQILFLCTGNYYRSRFAEHLFNHHAPDYQLPWRAFSRGLALEMLDEDAGPISQNTLKALTARGIPLEGEVRSPIALAEQDLIAAHHIIALKHAEHHPLMNRKFPDWTERVEYWHVHDIDYATPEEALPQIEYAVQALLERLAI